MEIWNPVFVVVLSHCYYLEHLVSCLGTTDEALNL